MPSSPSIDAQFADLASQFASTNATSAAPVVSSSPPDIDSQFAELAAQKYNATQSQTKTAPQTSPHLGWLDYSAALPESVAQIASGALGSVAGGLAGLADIPLRAAGISQTAPADVVRGVQNAMTYQPRTAGGQMGAQALNYLPQKYGQLANYAGGKVSDWTGSPLAGAAVNTGIQALPLLAGAKFAAPEVSATAPALDPAVASARAAGLKLTPTQANAGVLGRAIESLTGSAKLERVVSKANAVTVDNGVKQDLGLPANAPLNDATLQAAKIPHNAVYNAVSKVGNVPVDDEFRADIAGINNRTGAGSFGFDVPPTISKLQEGYGSLDNFDAGDAVQKIRQLRKDGRTNLKIYDPEKNALGQAQVQVANAIENQLDRHIQSGAFQGPDGQIAPDLVDQWRNARVQLAKIHSAEDALDAGHISTADLARQLNKGVPLSGNMRTFAEAHGNFDRSLQDISKIRNSGPFSALDPFLGAVAGHFSPPLAASMFAAPLARAGLASRLYQDVGIGKSPLNIGGVRLTGAPSFPGLLGSPQTFPLLQQYAPALSAPQGLLTEQRK